MVRHIHEHYQHPLHFSQITYAQLSTKAGPLLLAANEHRICFSGFTNTRDPIKHFQRTGIQADSYRVSENSIRSLYNTFLQGEPLTLLTWGTPFQLSVWEALLDTSFGQTLSYSLIAEIIGKPKAVRAVGSAVGANRLAPFIPCHRIVRGDGSLGGYLWGLECKKTLLKLEAANLQAKLT